MTEAPPIQPVPTEPVDPLLSLLDPCTCLRDGKPCGVCVLWDKHIGWLEARPEADPS